MISSTWDKDIHSGNHTLCMPQEEGVGGVRNGGEKSDYILSLTYYIHQTVTYRHY